MRVLQVILFRFSRSCNASFTVIHPVHSPIDLRPPIVDGQPVDIRVRLFVCRPYRVVVSVIRRTAISRHEGLLACRTWIFHYYTMMQILFKPVCDLFLICVKV